MKPRVFLLRFGVGWAEWVWELPGVRFSGFDTLADAADDARAWVSDHTTNRPCICRERIEDGCSIHDPDHLDGAQ